MLVVLVFLFKQKTAYEMRISDWSSDVCSSDLSTRRCSPERQSKYPREEGDHAMTIAIDRNCLSPKRGLLCSRENALRVPGRIFDHSQTKVSILRTSDPMQPFRVSTDPASAGLIALEMVAYRHARPARDPDAHDPSQEGRGRTGVYGCN